jgi:predicted TIM-barrel fold metal-dependent hydrolase
MPVEAQHYGSAVAPLVAMDTGSGYYDISMVGGIEGIARLVRQLPAGKVLFGSHILLFYFESAFLKMQEPGLSESQKQAMLDCNAKRLLAQAASRKP